MFNKSMILAAVIASAQLNAEGFDMSDPLSKANKTFTVKLYRAACYAEEYEKLEVGELSKEAQDRLGELLIEWNKSNSRFEMAANEATKEILNDTGSCNYLSKERPEDIAQDQKMKNRNDALSDLLKAEKELKEFKESIQQKQLHAPKSLPALGGMEFKNLQSAKNTLRTLVNGFENLSKDDATKGFMSVIKSGFSDDVMNTLIEKYGEQAQKDYNQYYEGRENDPCKK